MIKIPIGDWFLARSEAFKLLMMKFRDHKINTKEAFFIIYKYSHGVPRLINTMCDNAFLESFLLKKKEINEELLAGVIEDLGLDMKSPRLSGFFDNPATGGKEELTQAAEKDEIDLLFQGLEAN